MDSKDLTAFSETDLPLALEMLNDFLGVVLKFPVCEGGKADISVLQMKTAALL